MMAGVYDGRNAGSSRCSYCSFKCTLLLVHKLPSKKLLQIVYALRVTSCSILHQNINIQLRLSTRIERFVIENKLKVIQNTVERLKLRQQIPQSDCQTVACNAPINGEVVVQRHKSAGICLNLTSISICLNFRLIFNFA